MPGKRITVVLAQSPSKNPAKRDLEEQIAAALLMTPGIEFSIVPHLYDLTPDHTGLLFLRSVAGDLVVLSWLYPRATRWVLDRSGVRGQEGVSLLKGSDDEEEDDDGEETADAEASRGIGSIEAPNRRIYCLDLRERTDAAAYIDEVKRIAAEAAVQPVSIGDLSAAPVSVGGPLLQEVIRLPLAATDEAAAPHPVNGASLVGDEPVRRRWYPVIDYSRCTNCMECIDFCLFGVYGVDRAETILVEQPDNCRKGCPACSRVCPENAIIFPQHKTPAIAGAAVHVGILKIDLSKLFGAPENSEDAFQAAVRERDEQLVLAGRDAVGATVGLPKRHVQISDQPKDDLDELIDSLDELDL
jgi:hypothetical protein